MVLNSYREQADTVIKPIAEKMSWIDPNILSWTSLIFAFLAGVSFYLGTMYSILLASIFVICNSFFDAMDGRVAKLTGKASLKGDFLDHVIDRYADIFILTGIAFSPLCRLDIGLLAIIGVLMTSYMGTQAHAVGVGRNYGGVAGRADRLILIILIPIVYAVSKIYFSTSFTIFNLELGVFDVLMIWFAIAGNLTAVIRGIKTWKEF